MQVQIHSHFVLKKQPVTARQAIEMYHVNTVERAVLENMMRFASETTPIETAEIIKKLAPEFTFFMHRLLENNPPCGIAISGLPVIADKTERLHMSEKMSLAFSHLIGLPFQYLQQNNGKLVALISPREGFENTHSGLGRQQFGWHTDDCIFALEHRTQWIQLHGVVNDGNTETLFSLIDAIVEMLPFHTKNILMQARFEVKMPTSFGFRHQIWSHPVPLVWRNENDEYEVGVPTYHVRTIDQHDEEAHTALKIFFDAIQACRHSIIIQPDMLFIFNNNRLLHGRGTVIGERIVLRTYIRRNLQALRAATDSEGSVFDARFLI